MAVGHGHQDAMGPTWCRSLASWTTVGLHAPGDRSLRGAHIHVEVQSSCEKRRRLWREALKKEK